MAEPLAKTNKYISNAATRAEILRRQAIESSAFEGIHGLDQVDLASTSAKADSRAPRKKAVKGAPSPT